MDANTDESLELLMARLADGDRSVFSEVFKRLWSPTHRLCMTFLKNEADAADAAQQAMTKILERASDYDRSRRVMPWALAIAAWECRTLRKKLARRREIPEHEAAEPTGDDAQEEIARRDLIQTALSAMDELSPMDRETLIATFWDEAGAVSGATFRKRRERALERLRNSWKRLYGLD
jgi:RNA polymerase sigma-70 factor (ECF subfamily)